MTEVQKHIETLIALAAKSNDSGDAMRFAQAALNAANAALGLSNLSRICG